MEHHKDLDGVLYVLSKLGMRRDFLMIVVLIYFTNGLYNLEEDYQWIEYYAGKAACTYAMLRAGYCAARFDKLYFDPQCQRRRRNNFYDLNTPCGFALAVVFILKGRMADLLTWFGIKCSSWVAVNVGTSWRSACASTGDVLKTSVRESNCMLERTICLLALVCAKDGVWCLEQPGSSVLEFYPTWLHFLNACYQYYGINSVFRCGWWMSRYGAGSPKRQYAWSNGSAIKHLDVGWKKMKNKVQTVRHYIDKQGKKRYHGTKALSYTEIYPRKFADAIVKLREPLLNTRVNRLIPLTLPSGPEIVRSAGDAQGLFDTADLKSVFHYLRCGKGLNLPKHWQEVIPKPDPFMP